MVEALVGSRALDPYNAELKVRRGVPQVVHRIDAALADDVLGELHRREVMAFAPTQAELKAAGDARRIKRLIPRAGGGYVCEMWRGEGDAFGPEDLAVMVRARVKQSETSTTVSYNRRAAVGGYLAGGAAGAMIGASATTSRDTSLKMTIREILDLHMRDGRCLRLD